MFGIASIAWRLGWWKTLNTLYMVVGFRQISLAIFEHADHDKNWKPPVSPFFSFAPIYSTYAPHSITIQAPALRNEPVFSNDDLVI